MSVLDRFKARDKNRIVAMKIGSFGICYPLGEKELRRKYRFVLVILFGLLGLLVVGVYFSLGRSAPRDPLEIAYEKIEEGMGCAEAMDIVGPQVPVDTDPFDET